MSGLAIQLSKRRPCFDWNMYGHWHQIYDLSHDATQK